MNRRRGVWATLAGTVVAHRIFDLVPIVLLVLYVLVTAKIPAWAYSIIVAVVSVGATLFVLAVAQRPLGIGHTSSTASAPCGAR